MNEGTSERIQAGELLWTELQSRFDGRELERVRGLLEMWSGARPRRVDYEHQEFYGFYMPGLPDDVWLAPEDFPFHERIAAASERIRSEARSLANGTRKAPAFALAADADVDAPAQPDERGYEWPEGWREWRFYDYNQRLDERCSAFPVTAAVADEIRSVSDYVARIHFLLMVPDTHVQKHVDETNFFVNYQLCVASTPDAGFEVAGMKHAWREGDIRAFNAGYFHSAWNHHDRDTRVLFSVRTFHPALTAVERQALLYLMSRVTYVRTGTSLTHEDGAALKSA